MKMYRGSSGIAPLILNMAIVGGLWTPATLPPGEDPRVPTAYEAGWAPLPVRRFRRREEMCNLYLVWISC